MGKKIAFAAVAGVVVVAGGAGLIWSLYASVQEEAAAFEQCVATEQEAGDDIDKTIAAYRDFLKAYPDGAHAKQAQQKIDEELPAKIDDRAFARAAASASGEDFGKSIEAYKAYLAAYPEGRHATEARIKIENELPGKIDDREYAKVKKFEEEEPSDFEKVIAAYQAHLENFPECIHAEEARAKIETKLPAKIDEREYAKVKALETEKSSDFEKVIAAYQTHLENFPECPHAKEARAKIETEFPAKIDEREYAAALKRVKEAGNDLPKILAAYNDYLKRFPKGIHAAEAAERVKNLPAKLDRETFQRAREAEKADPTKGLDAYRKYLAAFPGGLHRTEAEARVKALTASLQKQKRDDDAYAKAAKVEAGCGDNYEKAIRAYLEYLADHPTGTHAMEVSKHIKTTLPGKILARDYDRTMKIIEAEGHRGTRAATACLAFLEVHSGSEEAAKIRTLLETIRKQQGIAAPWEFRVTSFRTAETHTFDVAGKSVSLEAPKGDVIVLVGVTFKALRTFNAEEKKMISAMRLGKKMDTMRENLSLGDVPYITSRSCTMNITPAADEIVVPCAGLDKPNMTFQSGETARTIPAGTEFETTLAFILRPGSDRTPLLVFTPHPGSREFFAAKISLDEKGNLKGVNYGSLGEMKR